MSVIYYDVVNLMGLGTARQVPTLQALLEGSDFVTLHVPESPDTKKMIGAPQLEQMKKGSYLINASRGSVVDIPALINAMRAGKIAGAALDVYPKEPGGNGDYFTNDLNQWAEDLRSLKNIILTPHIGGSTEEAQSAIGVEGKMGVHNADNYAEAYELTREHSGCGAGAIYQRREYIRRRQSTRGESPVFDLGRTKSCSSMVFRSAILGECL